MSEACTGRRRERAQAAPHLFVRIASQDKPLAEAQRVRTQIDAIAIGLHKLAAQGNGKAVVDLLKQRGIDINPGASESK